jgi:hypothetical protein
MRFLSVRAATAQQAGPLGRERLCEQALVGGLQVFSFQGHRFQQEGQARTRGVSGRHARSTTPSANAMR